MHRFRLLEMTASSYDEELKDKTIFVYCRDCHLFINTSTISSCIIKLK